MTSMLISLTNNLSPVPPIVKKLLCFKVCDDDKFNEKAVKALVKKLKKSGTLDDFENIITHIRDTQHTKCITIPRSQDGRLQISQRKCFPHVMYCKIWRWCDLTSSNELKSIQTCVYSFNSKKDEVCINPYHYLRILNNNNNDNNNNNNQNMNILTPSPSSSNSSSSSSSSTTSSNNNNNLTIYVPIKNECNDVTMSEIQPQQQQQQLQTPLMSNLITTTTTSTTAATISNSFIDYTSSSSYHLDSPLSNTSSHNPLSPSTSHYVSEDDSSELHSSISPMPTISSNYLNNNTIPVPYQEQSHWCSISYYELKQRVGETFHASATVNSLTIDGYTDPSRAERFCLGVLSNINRTPEVELTRRYIGRGIRLENTGLQVFAECLSENPVFVQSPICNKQQNWHLATVCKIPPGCKLPIFDINVFYDLLNQTITKGYEEVYALTRICTIRMSFVKGWGADYRRQSILNTPCWIEIHLNNPLQWIDHILHQMGSPRIKCTSNS